MKLRKTHGLLVGLALMLGVSWTIADPPTTMNFQGRLTDTSPGQVPIDVTLPMEFRIYDALSGGSQLWSESWPAVTVSDGLFQVSLGSNGSPLGETVFDGPDRFLEIVVNAETLAPRQKLAAVGFAQQAKNSDSLGGNPASAWQMSLLNSCGSGFYLQQINPDGSIVCGVDANSGGDITGVTAGSGLTGGGISGFVSLGVEFDGPGSSDSAARSDHTHDGAPVPPGSAQKAQLTGFGPGPIDGWISGQDPLSTQNVQYFDQPFGAVILREPWPASIGEPEIAPQLGVLTFTTPLTTDAWLLEWLRVAVNSWPGGLPDIVLVLFDEQNAPVRTISINDAWPYTWSLDYLPTGEPIVHVKIAGQSMVLQ